MRTTIEGCAAYQRDYVSEGDVWWGMFFAREGVRDKRDTANGVDDNCDSVTDN